MGRPAKHLSLTAEEDHELRTLEQHPHLRPKVRLRAQAVRLSAKGWTLPQVAEHLGRHPDTVRQDLLRWERHGVAGLADRTAPGRASRITSEIAAFLQEKLAEDRQWTCTSLAEAIAEAFGVRISREPLRLKLHAWGYRWKRARYVPTRPPDPEAEAAARQELAALKRGLKNSG